MSFLYFWDSGFRILSIISYLFLTGDLESFKKQAFVLKEGVEYRIKISFKVRAAPQIQLTPCV